MKNLISWQVRLILYSIIGYLLISLLNATAALALPVTILLASPSNPSVQECPSFSLTYNWQGGPTDQSLTVFVHFVDSAGSIAFGDDHSPPTPTDQWSGTISYTRTITIPGLVTVGTYKIMAGLYDTGTDQRLILNPGTGVIPDDEIRYQIGVLTVTVPATLPIGQTLPIYIQYHVWFTKGSCPSSNPEADWWHWSWSPDHNPCETPFPWAPWLMELSSPGYPLIGPYDSSNDKVLRWHIRLAKAAGVSGFFVSVYSFCTVCTPSQQEIFWSNFSKMLDIAEEEDFFLGIEDWQPLDLTDNETWKAEVQNQIDTFASHPAFLRINDKPAIWFSFDLQWMSLDELIQFLDSRSTFWIIGGITLDQLRTFEQKSTQAQATQLLTYNVPTTNGWSFLFPDFEGELRNLDCEGFVSIAHGYPGFDERAMPDREERRFGLRNNGQILNDFLSASVQGKAQAIILESFNDFAEYTQFEPGFDIQQYRDTGQEVIYSEDPYLYLSLLADFKGVSWVTPMPPCSIVDFSLLQYDMMQCAAPSEECVNAENLEVEPTVLTLGKRESDNVTVTVAGEDDCPVEGDTVKARVDEDGEKLIKVSPNKQRTDENGQAVFKIKAKNKTGSSTVTFKDGILSATVNVTIVE